MILTVNDLLKNLTSMYLFKLIYRVIQPAEEIYILVDFNVLFFVGLIRDMYFNVRVRRFASHFPQQNTA
jgi:hypothetical protein